MKKFLFILLFLLIPITLCSCFKDDKTYYTVSFITFCDTVIPEQRVKELDLAVRPEDPVNGNKTFVGWYTTSDFVILYDFENYVTEDKILYAKWTDGGTGTKVDNVEFSYSASRFDRDNLFVWIKIKNNTKKQITRIKNLTCNVYVDGVKRAGTIFNDVNVQIQPGKTAETSLSYPPSTFEKAYFTGDKKNITIKIMSGYNLLYT